MCSIRAEENGNKMKGVEIQWLDTRCVVEKGEMGVEGSDNVSEEGWTKSGAWGLESV